MSSKLSLYIHFPFCASKCRYCDFYSESGSLDLVNSYLHALILEWKSIRERYSLDDVQIETIYFGGGTPSLLSPEQFTYLCKELIGTLKLSDDLEWSVECNPDSYTEEKGSIYYENGVTRITFGIQSLDNRELRFLGRRHTAERALEVLFDQSLRQFVSVGADLMFGIPLQTVASFERSLVNVLSSPYIKHLSQYELTLCENTPFGRHVSKLPLPTEDEISEMVESSVNVSKNHGFEHYEVSNFALPGFHSRHNEKYWDHQNYIGLGAAAHSYLHPWRWANESNIYEYNKKCYSGNSPVDFIEELDGVKLAHEILFLGLRRKSGINEILFKERTGVSFCNDFTYKKLNLFIENGYLIYHDSWWQPTEKGLLYADAMARDLF